jgi:hypothetical protein
MPKPDPIPNFQHPDFSRSAVRKHWGNEFECYNNGIVSVWILQINGGEATSLHAHPHKLTGLVVLGGEVRLDFLEEGDSRHARALDKTKLGHGFFHSTTAITDAIVLEIEQPPLKYDLVRLSDRYGREGKPYEGAENYFQRDGRHPNLINDDGQTSYVFGESELSIHSITDEPTMYHYINKYPDGMSVFLKGGLFSEHGAPVSVPGHVVWHRTMLRTLTIASPSEDTEIILIRRFKPNG